jgi:DNA repair exonuclease SbcCD ATPase subunit
MRIKKVKITNFYSAKKVEFDFDKQKNGIVLIEGQNKDAKGSNGAGKSILIESVVWGLFGKTIRKSTEEAMVNNRAKKEMSVEVYVDDLRIKRSKRPTSLQLWKGDEEITQDNALNTQKKIEELLNTNYKVFLASTVFGQQNNIEFLTATPDDKRTIIRNFLNLDDLFTMRESVKYLKSEYNQGSKRLSAVLAEQESSVTTYDQEIQVLKDQLADVDPELMDSCRDLTLDDVLSVEAHNRSVDKKVEDISREIVGAQRRAEAFLKDAKNNTCRTCGQEVKKPMSASQVEDKAALYDMEIESLGKDLAKAESARRKVVVSSKVFCTINEYKNIEDKMSFLERQKDALLEKMQNVHDERGDYNTQYEIMKFWEKAFSEQGIVKYVIRNILGYFNAQVNFYLSHLSRGKYFIEFDEALSETITHMEHEIHFISMSGGEKKKVSLAVLLGLQSLLGISNAEEVNLMFFDEIAESLDHEGMEGLYILLSELKKTKTLYVITHNNYLKSLMDNSTTVTMIKSKGISKLKTK